MEQVARFRFSALAGAALLLAGSTIPARAQADPDDAKRGVARISVMDGDVTVRRGDSGDWVAGVINAPLLTGDQIATAPNSRAEVQFDAANAVRMGGDASLRIAQLEYDRYQFQLARGTVTYRVLRPTEVNIEVDTQNLAIRPSKQGVYRIRVDDAGLSEVTVRLGSVEVSTTAGSQWVNAGQTLLARGPAADPEFKIAAAIPIDDWDHWNESRDAAELTSASNQYVPDGVYGAEDLDRYGTWSNVPDYGYVWQPSVPVGWSPYSLGQWTWEDWYGWTWVSCDPWGWAPYHYGRWFFRPQNGWAWYPGARFSRHYWSPGLVAFMGWGGAGFGLGYVGWVPLAPYEVFRPWWGRSYYGRPGYMNRNIGISSVNISNIYRNAAIAGGVVGVHGTDFQNGRFQTISHFSGAQIRDARVAQGAMPLAPGAANLRFSAKAIATTPRANANQQFFSREQPSPAARIPFAQQQRAFQAARAGNSSPVAQSGARQATPGQPGAWNRFGDRTAQETQPQSNRNVPQAQNPAARENDAPAQQDRAGWQRFGAPGAQTEGGGRPATPPAAQSGANGWNRFGSPGSAVPNAPRPQNPAPAYRAPQYSAPSRPSAPQSSPSRPSGGGGGGGGGMSHSGGSGGASGGGGHSSGGGGGGHSGGGGGGGHR